MPDHTVGAAPGVDQQAQLPGQVLHLHERARAEYPVAALLDAQFALLPTVAARQQVVALGAIQAEQRHPRDIADLPIGVQGLAEPAGFAVLVRGAQAQPHLLAQFGLEGHRPVAQLQLPGQAHALLVRLAAEQLPVAQPRPAMGRPTALAGVTAEPGPAHRHAAANRPAARPMAGAPQPRALAARLEVQQLATLAAEYGLKTRMLD